MSRLDRNRIARSLLNAPGWARLGITAPSERLREDAAEELARVILGEAIDQLHSEDQMRLPI